MSDSDGGGIFLHVLPARSGGTENIDLQIGGRYLDSGLSKAICGSISTRAKEVCRRWAESKGESLTKRWTPFQSGDSRMHNAH